MSLVVGSGVLSVFGGAGSGATLTVSNSVSGGDGAGFAGASAAPADSWAELVEGGAARSSMSGQNSSRAVRGPRGGAGSLGLASTGPSGSDCHPIVVSKRSNSWAPERMPKPKPTTSTKMGASANAATCRPRRCVPSRLSGARSREASCTPCGESSSERSSANCCGVRHIVLKRQRPGRRHRKR